MAKYQWTAASETVGSPPSGLNNAYTADGQSLSDWEIVADASAYGGKALKMVGTTSLRRRLTIPGVSAGIAARIDMRGRVYQPENSAATIHFVSLLIEGTGASDGNSYYAIITSSGQLQINAYEPSLNNKAQTIITFGQRVGWWNFRFTYDPPPASTRFRLAIWLEGGSGSDTSPDYVLTLTGRATAVDGDLVGLGAFSANDSLVDWITVGTGADDADAAPAEEAAELAGAATASASAAGALSAAPASHALEGAAVASATASAALGASLTLDHDIDAGNVDPTSVVITNPTTYTPTVAASIRGVQFRQFLFALDGANGKRPSFEIDRSNGFNTFASNWLPVWTSDFEVWHQAASRSTADGKYAWSFAEDFDADRVYVASFPIGQERHAGEFAAELLADYPSVVAPAASADSAGVYNTTPAETDDLGRAVGGNAQYALQLSWPGPTTDGLRKRKLVMWAGIHAQGENHSWFGFRAAVRWMLDDTSEAAEDFRSNWDVWVYFNITPNGLKGGHTRTNFRSTQDPNRDFYLAASSTLSEIQALRTAVVADVGGAADALYSWHGANARSTLCNLFLRTIDYNSGTRRPAYAEFVSVAPTFFGEAASLIESTNTTTDNWWGEAKLGAAISFACELQGLGETSLSGVETVSRAWMQTLQAVDAADLILPPADFSSNVTVAATAAADLSTAIQLNGAAILTGTAAGSLTTAVQLAAQALAGGQAVGSLSTAIQLGGAAVSAVVSAGELTAQIRLEGAALAAAGATGDITTLIVLQGAAVASLLASAALTTSPSGLAGDATAGVTAAGALTTAIQMVGGAQVSVIASGAVGTTVSLAGAAVAVVTATGDLVIALELSADAVAAAVAGASLTTAITLRADAVAGAQASGALTTQPLEIFGVLIASDRRKQRSRRVNVQTARRTNVQTARRGN